MGRSRITPAPDLDDTTVDSPKSSPMPKAPPVASNSPQSSGYVSGASLHPRKDPSVEEAAARAPATPKPAPIKKKRTEKIDQKRTLNFTQAELDILKSVHRAISRDMLDKGEDINIYETEIPRIALYLLEGQPVEKLREILNKMPRFRSS